MNRTCLNVKYTIRKRQFSSYSYSDAAGCATKQLFNSSSKNRLLFVSRCLQLLQLKDYFIKLFLKRFFLIFTFTCWLYFFMKRIKIIMVAMVWIVLFWLVNKMTYSSLYSLDPSRYKTCASQEFVNSARYTTSTLVAYFVGYTLRVVKKYLIDKFLQLYFPEIVQPLSFS